MKCLLVLFGCVILANALDQKLKEEFYARMEKLGEKCSEETKASADDIADLIARRVPPTHEGKCMIFCFHKDFHIQKPDGSLDPEGAVASLEPLKTVEPEIYDKMLQVFKACEANTPMDSDPCITAANLAQCAIDEGKKIGLHDMLEI